MMRVTKGRDSTLDPYYFSGLGYETGESGDVEQLRRDVEQLQATVNGTPYEDGLVQQVAALEEAVEDLRQKGTKIEVHDTEYYEEHGNDTSYLNMIYVYSDEIEGELVQKIKIGDGVTKIGDLPFIARSDAQTVTQEEKDRWNNKVSCSFDSEEETLILTTDD